LRADVYAFFSFVPGRSRRQTDRPLLRETAFLEPSFCSPRLADGHVSILFELGRRCDADLGWREDGTACGSVTGPLTIVGRTQGSERPEMVGAYFRPARAEMFLGVATTELTDRVVAIDELWGASAASLAAELSDLDEAGRIARLESALLARLSSGRPPTGALDLAGLAAHILQRRGRTTVEALAEAAGVSRQHLSRTFRRRMGIPPKVYIRLARFQSGLAYAGRQARVDWADAAVDLGYADQSHMIAEFRRFSGLTPHALASRYWFHPFIERARRPEVLLRVQCKRDQRRVLLGAG